MLSLQCKSFSEPWKVLIANQAEKVKEEFRCRQQEIENRDKFIKHFKATFVKKDSRKKIAELSKGIQSKLDILTRLKDPQSFNTSYKTSTVSEPRISIENKVRQHVNNIVIENEINNRSLTLGFDADVKSARLDKDVGDEIGADRNSIELPIPSEKKIHVKISSFDERLNVKPCMRSKRLLNDSSSDVPAKRIRTYNQLKALEKEEKSHITQKNLTRSSHVLHKKDNDEDVPSCEWWDSVILEKDLDTIVNDKIAVRHNYITNLIEHPVQVRPPNESTDPVFLPAFFTKKEQKKLRRQNRREAQLERREKIRLGLIDPSEPKLKISNFMRILENEAIQDPTKIESRVHEQIAKRQEVHCDAKEARKLTKEKRREKKIKKISEDTSMGVHVSVYRIRNLHNVKAKKCKVETNAKQLHMSGIITIFPDCCVVVVEGGPKQQKSFRRLIMHRIKWNEDLIALDNTNGFNDGENKTPNSCNLLWQGKVLKRSFGEVKVDSFFTEQKARECFQKHQCEHYWDLAYAEKGREW